MEIHLEEWNKNREYDRLGLEDNYTEYLGNKVICYRVPVRPGRNVAIICEAAAANHRQKLMGYNAAQELYKRVQNNLMRKSRENDKEDE
jgi:HPr kinase/phosphorylase